MTHGEKVELLQHARATLFPIEWDEPFGLVMIESMACGTPVIATRCGAVSEVIEDGVQRHHRRPAGATCRRRSSSVDATRLPRVAATGTSRSSSRPSGWSADYIGAYERRSPAGKLGRLPTRPAPACASRFHVRPRDLPLAVPALGAPAAEPLDVLVDAG